MICAAVPAMVTVPVPLLVMTAPPPVTAVSVPLPIETMVVSGPPSASATVTVLPLALLKTRLVSSVPLCAPGTALTGALSFKFSSLSVMLALVVLPAASAAVML